ncbi:hypothetical protein G6R29_02355 [Fructobacillus sp. M2-14]|uniref:Late embryogenesis abundant protein n=1 Tax=Fructobacillus broussonetiae TaxID=2713173 RepID=A0ABS5QZ51_9LACO|nr:hypothetical protein [Fructobacillus broussonetiae]MBS9338478.1 hypothetical protein [Fructobacillus broussonetiae]
MKNFLLGASLFGNAALAYLLLKDDDRVADWKDKAGDMVETGKAKGQDFVSYGKQKASDLGEAGKEKFNAVKKEATAKKNEAADSLDSQLSELKNRAEEAASK